MHRPQSAALKDAHPLNRVGVVLPGTDAGRHEYGLPLPTELRAIRAARDLLCRLSTDRMPAVNRTTAARGLVDVGSQVSPTTRPGEAYAADS